MIRRSLAGAPDGRTISAALIRPLLGGIWFVSRSRLLEGRSEALATCGAELLEWLLSYRSAAPVPLLGVPREAARPEPTLVFVSRTSVGEEVQECLLARLEFMSAQALARALRESEGAANWAEGVFWAIRAIFREIAEDRAFARAAFIDSFAAGPAGAERRTALMRGFADLLARRAPAESRPDPLVAEAIVGSVWSMAHRHVARDRAQRLPALSAPAAFLALAPIVGAEKALATVSG
jgi:hypothetical protein